jgi:membrane protease YdiL (CAAX protease family)
MDSTLFSLSILNIAVLAALFAIDWRKSLKNVALLGLFAIILFIDNLIIVGVNQVPHLQIIPNGYWGSILLVWSGKLFSIVVCLVLAVLLRQVISLSEIGLIWRQKKGSVLPSLLVLVIATAIAAGLGLNWEEGPFRWLVLVYMAIMPGLNEELVYRGLLLGILDHIKPPQWIFLGAKIGWGVCITALVFGLLHGFQAEPGFKLHIQWFPIFFSGMNGFLFAWQKERTGSLLIPILTHGAVDFFNVLVRMA